MTGEERNVITARIIGAVYRDAPKLKMFMISVCWSDATEVIIYRSLKDFKEFHGQLKRRFPNAKPFRKNDRVIPKFNGKARRSNFQQKGSKQSVYRMRFLERYCDKLMKCDQSVTHSSEVNRFFVPKDHDLQPDFTKNSVMILLSDDQPDGEGSRSYAGSVSHPFVTQTYRCVASYETKDTKNRPFKVALDEKLDVLIKDPAGWWLVENEDRCLAWFPAPYLELWDGEEDDDAEFQQAGALHCAVRSYTAKNNDEVSVPIGSVVEVLRKSDNGWWLVRFNGKGGYVPAMYLQPYNNPRAGLYSMQRKMHSSTLNLATSREPHSQHPVSVIEEEGAPGPLHKARSLDILSETWTQTHLGMDASTSEGRARSMSNTSTVDSLSGLSTSSESSSSLREEAQLTPPPGQSGNSSPNLSLSERPSSSSSSGSGSGSSPSNRPGVAAPTIPRRPKTEEILTRCTTMTRKAALATKSRLQVQPESSHSR